MATVSANSILKIVTQLYPGLQLCSRTKCQDFFSKQQRMDLRSPSAFDYAWLAGAANVREIYVGDAVATISGHTDDFSNSAEYFIDTLKPYMGDPNKLFRYIPTTYGHYALAIEDLTNAHTYLCADPLGFQPLYYVQSDKSVQWSFNLKSLLPGISNRTLDDRGLDEVLLYRWLVEDHTLIRNVRRVLPGECVCLRPQHAPVKHRYSNVEYRPYVDARNESALIETTDAAFDRYFARLRRKHSRIGLFFSGGVDSSLLAAKAREHNFERFIAVTPRFPGHANPEVERAVEVATHLGIEHRIVDVDDSFVGKALPSLVWQFESPISYFNNFPRMALMENVAPDVSFVLTGEGADGMFSQEVGMASRALHYKSRQRYINWMPKHFREALVHSMALMKSNTTIKLSNLLKTDTMSFMRSQGALFNPGKGNGSIRAEDLVPRLSEIRSNRSPHFYSAYEPVMSDSEEVFCQNRGLYTQNRHQYYCYAALASRHGIDVGAPFLSSEFLQIGLHLPNAMKHDEKGPKPILKKLAMRYLPPELVYAPKLGFETPYLDWINGPLSYWKTLLTERRTAARNLFDPQTVARLDPQKDAHLIWIGMTLELFLRQFIDGETPAG